MSTDAISPLPSLFSLSSFISGREQVVARSGLGGANNCSLTMNGEETGEMPQAFTKALYNNEKKGCMQCHASFVHSPRMQSSRQAEEFGKEKKKPLWDDTDLSFGMTIDGSRAGIPREEKKTHHRRRRHCRLRHARPR